MPKLVQAITRRQELQAQKCAVLIYGKSGILNLGVKFSSQRKHSLLGCLDLKCNSCLDSLAFMLVALYEYRKPQASNYIADAGLSMLVIIF